MLLLVLQARPAPASSILGSSSRHPSTSAPGTHSSSSEHRPHSSFWFPLLLILLLVETLRKDRECEANPATDQSDCQDLTLDTKSQSSYYGFPLSYLLLLLLSSGSGFWLLFLLPLLLLLLLLLLLPAPAPTPTTTSSSNSNSNYRFRLQLLLQVLLLDLASHSCFLL